MRAYSNIYFSKNWLRITTDLCNTISLLFGDFGSKVVLNISVSVHYFIHHHQWCFVWHIQSNLTRQTSCFWEQVQISRSKAQWNWLINIQHNWIIFISRFLLAQYCATCSNFSCNSELNVLFSCFDFDGLGQVYKLFAYSRELTRWHGANWCEFSFGNTHSLGVNCDEG